MIKLPDNYEDQAYMDQSTNKLILFYVNKAGEYFLWMHHIDPAFTWENHMEQIKREVDSQFPGAQAFVLNGDLSMNYLEPSDQEWRPAPLPQPHVVSFAQFKAHAKILQHEKVEDGA